MRRSALIFCICIAFVTPCANAQTTAVSFVDVTLEASGWAFPIIPLGTTTTDDIVVFYAHNNAGTMTLKTRLVRANGTMGPVRTIATGLDTGMWTTFDVVLHPQISKFLVVYRKGGKLYGRGVGATGIPLAAAKLITPYSRDFMALTWTSKKKYILFMEKSGQIAGQVLRKNGKKKKGDLLLTKAAKGEAIPLDAATDSAGIAHLVFSLYNSSTNLATLQWLSVDKKLNYQDSMELAANLTANSDNFLRNALVAYDPTSDVFGCAWRVAPAVATYCTFDSSGSFVKMPTTMPTDTNPRALVLDPASGTFANFYFILSYNGVTDLVDFYYTSFFPNGSLDMTGVNLKQVSNEIDFLGCGISRIGSTFIAWINDGGPSGVHGRLTF